MANHLNDVNTLLLSSQQVTQCFCYGRQQPGDGIDHKMLGVSLVTRTWLVTGFTLVTWFVTGFLAWFFVVYWCSPRNASAGTH